MANPVKAEPARLLTMDEEKLEAIRAVADAADAKSIYKETVTLAELVLGDAVKEIDALRDALGNNQRALASEAQHAEDARRIAGDHQEARKMPTCATCASNGACLIQRYAASTCRDDVPDDQRFGCTLHEPVASPPVPSPGEQR